jgi:hypothetical protein
MKANRHFASGIQGVFLLMMSMATRRAKRAPTMSRVAKKTDQYITELLALTRAMSMAKV